MYISISHAEPGVYASQFPTDANWNCAQLPTVNGKVEGKQQLWFGGSNLGINPATEHPDEAWEVMKFLHSDEVMGPYHTAGLGTVMIPSAVESAEAPESIEKMPNLAINADDQNWPPLPAGVVVEGKDYYTTCVECIFGVTDIDSAIEDLNTATTPLTTSWWTVVRSASSIPILIRSSRTPPSKIQTLSAEREPCPRALFLAFGGANGILV